MINCQGKMDASRNWHGQRITFCYRMNRAQEYRRSMHKGEERERRWEDVTASEEYGNRRKFGKMANSGTTTPWTLREAERGTRAYSCTSDCC